jgi:iron complex transport system substrate-binding protein
MNAKLATRHLLALALAASLLAAGCLSQPAAPPSDDEPGRTIEHATGTTTIEGTPERVVALEWNLVEDLVALGIQPVGVADVDGYENWVKAEPALSDNVTDIGTRQEPNLEEIASLQPDLILGVEYRHAPIEDRLSELAPTLLFDPYPAEGGPSQYERVMANFQTVAEAVDRPAAANETLADLESTFAEQRQRLADANGTEHPIVLAQAFTSEGSSTLRLFTDNALAVQVLDRLGLANAWDDGHQTYGFSTVGLEAVERVEEASFLYVAQPDDDPVNDTYSDDPAWRNFTFVQEDRVYPLGADVWLFGGPLSAGYLAEATVDALLAGGADGDR